MLHEWAKSWAKVGVPSSSPSKFLYDRPSTVNVFGQVTGVAGVTFCFESSA